jgi:hypothetical protein
MPLRIAVVVLAVFWASAEPQQAVVKPKAAKPIGLTIPPSVLALADTVIK